jgi:hypothetical protein
MTNIEDYVAERGGRIVRPPYFDAGIRRVGLVCGSGHSWAPRVGNLLSCGSWCPECYGNAPALLKNLQQWAIALGGKCLSVEYTNNKAKYRWECGTCAHQWEATWYNIKCHHSWCPACKFSNREIVVRAAFQEMFPGESFDTDRQAIGMELDGYSEKNELAFECDGVQHRVRVPHFQRNEGDFEAQQARDREKDDRAFVADIHLIRVPDRLKLPLGKIREFVHARVLDMGWAAKSINTEFCSEEEFQRGICQARTRDKYIERVRKIVTTKGGFALTSVVPAGSWPVHVVCEHGHPFTTSVDNLDRGRWCPTCGGTVPKTTFELQSVAEGRGYTFVSTEIHKDNSGKSRRYVTVKCPNATHPEATLSWGNFKAGKGCAKCNRAKGSQKKKAAAIQKILGPIGFEVVGAYQTKSAAAVFKCAEGHLFTSSLTKVERLPAPHCPVCTIATKFVPMRLNDKWVVTTNMAKTKLSWVCMTCSESSETTYRGMCIRKYKCSNKRCPSHN